MFWFESHAKMFCMSALISWTRPKYRPFPLTTLECLSTSPTPRPPLTRTPACSTPGGGKSTRLSWVHRVPIIVLSNKTFHRNTFKWLYSCCISANKHNRCPSLSRQEAWSIGDAPSLLLASVVQGRLGERLLNDSHLLKVLAVISCLMQPNIFIHDTVIECYRFYVRWNLLKSSNPPP